MRILGIETSCDETGVAIYDSEIGLTGHLVHSQGELHQDYGGVVPELASRDHITRLSSMIDQVLQESRVQPNMIDGIAYTAGPGLMGALLVGASLARSLALALNIPAVGIHHMEGHLLAPMLEEDPPAFPFIALLVSGGHTLLVHVKELGQYTVLGQSLDDAVGEAFDKTAKLLGLGYPGGPELAELAKKGNSQRFNFPRPMTSRPGLDFSFSGLKTCAVDTLRQHGNSDQTRADIATAFQEAAVDTLVIKCKRAIKETGLGRLVIAGGVSANQRLRQCLGHLIDEQSIRVYYPRLEFCTDNGAMIAYAGYRRLSAGQCEPLSFSARPRWSLEEIALQ